LIRYNKQKEAQKKLALQVRAVTLRDGYFFSQFPAASKLQTSSW
jgi:CRISPR/Cas system-associated protein endoribonuclease Cas2